MSKEGKEIVDALGLDDKQVYSIDICLRVGERCRITVGMFESLEQNEGLRKVLKEYELKPKEEK